jgi:hypothetical protein
LLPVALAVVDLSPTRGSAVIQASGRRCSDFRDVTFLTKRTSLGSADKGCARLAERRTN